MNDEDEWLFENWPILFLLVPLVMLVGLIVSAVTMSMTMASIH